MQIVDQGKPAALRLHWKLQDQWVDVSSDRNGHFWVMIPCLLCLLSNIYICVFISILPDQYCLSECVF